MELKTELIEIVRRIDKLKLQKSEIKRSCEYGYSCSESDMSWVDMRLQKDVIENEVDLISMLQTALDNKISDLEKEFQSIIQAAE